MRLTLGDLADSLTRGFEFEPLEQKHSLTGSASSCNKCNVAGQWVPDASMHLFPDFLEPCLKIKEVYNIIDLGAKVKLSLCDLQVMSSTVNATINIYSRVGCVYHTSWVRLLGYYCKE